MAQNAPVQGSAADIFKLAMIDVDRALDDGGSRTRMILTVHDELVFEVPSRSAKTIEPLVRDVMETVTELRVPLVVDIGLRPQLGRREVTRVPRRPGSGWHRVSTRLAVSRHRGLDRVGTRGRSSAVGVGHELVVLVATRLRPYGSDRRTFVDTFGDRGLREREVRST